MEFSSLFTAKATILKILFYKNLKVQETNNRNNTIYTFPPQMFQKIHRRKNPKKT